MKKSFVLITCLLGTYFSAYASMASYNAWKADQAYKKGDLAAARHFYEEAAIRHPDDMVSLYNVGKVASKMKDYGAAQAAFEKVTQSLHSSKQLKEQASFNKGDAFLLDKQYEQALKAYQDVLALNSSNEHAKKRIELVKKLLEQQKQEEQEQKSQDKNNKQNKQNKNDKSSQSNGQQKKKEQDSQGSGDQKQQGRNEKKESQSDSSKDSQNSSNNGRKEQGNQRKDKNDGQQDKSEDEGQDSKDEKTTSPKDGADSKNKPALNKEERSEQEKQGQDQEKNSSDNEKHNNPQQSSADPSLRDKSPRDASSQETKNSADNQQAKNSGQAQAEHVQSQESEGCLASSVPETQLSDQEKKILQIVEHQDKAASKAFIKGHIVAGDGTDGYKEW